MAPAKAEEDPVVAEYDVYITPGMQTMDELYLLQYPIRNRAQAYNERNSSRPIEMRLKKKSKFMEMDVQMSTDFNFNKAQGLVWGKAMQKAKTHGTNTFGAAAGFGQGGGAQSARGQRGGDMDEYVGGDIDKFGEALKKDGVFHKQTLGGHLLQREDGTPHYMLGAFRGNELHLTRINSVAQIRPQFHHVDAVVAADKFSRERDPDDTRPAPQARAVTIAYKDSRDTIDPKVLRDKNLMQTAQEEHWTRLTYFDEDDDESYEAYHEMLFVQQTANAGRLQSSMNNEEYLDAISAPRNDPGGRRKKRPLTRKQRKAIDLAEDDIEVVDQPQDGQAHDGEETQQ